MPWYSETPAAAPLACAGATTCGPDSPIYVVGGYVPHRPVALGAAYDTHTRTWSPIHPMPTARAALAVTATSGRVHALGGEEEFTEGVTTHEIYAPADDAWTTAAPMPTARKLLAAATGHDGVVYAIGGIHTFYSEDHTLGAVEAYDPATDTWESRAPMPTPRWGAAAVTAPDGLVYVIGGVADDASGNEIRATVEAYDPVSDTWSDRPALPTAVLGPGAALGPGGLIIVTGGTGHVEPSGATFSFDPARPDGTWTSLAPMPTARCFVAAATGPDGLIHVIGGTAGSYPDDYSVDVVEAYAYTPPEPVFDHIPILIGRLIGGVARDGAGGILIGDHYIPVPPRSPLMEAILEVAGERLSGAVADRQLGELGRKLQRESAATRWSQLVPGQRRDTRS
jgi:hypothetical protein